MGLFNSYMDANRQAWVRKRPGQASGSDYPRQPQSPRPQGSREPPRSAHSRSRGPPADYEEEVPIGMSRGPPPPPPPRRDSRAPNYEEEVPAGMSRGPPPPPQRGPASRDSRAPDYQEQVPIGMSRGETPPPQRQASHHHSSRSADRNPRHSSHASKSSRHDSRAVREDLLGLSIHSRHESHAAGFEDDGRYSQHSQRQASRRGPKVSFQEPQMSRHESRRGESRYESRRDSRR